MSSSLWEFAERKYQLWRHVVDELLRWDSGCFLRRKYHAHSEGARCISYSSASAGRGTIPLRNGSQRRTTVEDFLDGVVRASRVGHNVDTWPEQICGEGYKTGLFPFFIDRTHRKERPTRGTISATIRTRWRPPPELCHRQ